MSDALVMAVREQDEVQTGVQLGFVAQKAKLDIKVLHESERALAALAQFADSEDKLLLKHATKLFEHVCNRDGTAQQQKGDCMIKRASKRKIQLKLVAEEEAQLAKQDHKAQQLMLKQQCISTGLKNAEAQAADLAITKFFYANAIPFEAASSEPNSLYRRMYRRSNLPRQKRDPEVEISAKCGIINSAFITANDGGIFWRSVDTSRCTQSAEYCAALMIEDIYKFGPLIKVISNHHFPLEKLREMVKSKLGKAKQLVKAGGTRFGTNTFVGERLLELKSSLLATVVDEVYAAQNYKDKKYTEDETAQVKDESFVRTNKGKISRSLIIIVL
ncbi:MAG: hypothetical protein SGPRY_010812 [Prymnesium sp.]